MTTRRALAWGGALLLVAGAGYLAAWLLYPAPLVVAEVEVPALRGVARDDALAQLASLGLRGRDAGELADPLVPRGTVSWQQPPAGTRLPAGSAVRVGTSTGAPMVVVPDVVAFDLALAERVLGAAGLAIGTVDTVASADPAGTVVRTRPAARSAVRAGTSVQVTVSRGPRPAHARSE